MVTIGTPTLVNKQEMNNWTDDQYILSYAKNHTNVITNV